MTRSPCSRPQWRLELRVRRRSTASIQLPSLDEVAKVCYCPFLSSEVLLEAERGGAMWYSGNFRKGLWVRTAAVLWFVILGSLAQAGPALDLSGTWDISMVEQFVVEGISQKSSPAGLTQCEWAGTLQLTQTNGSLSGSINVTRSAGDPFDCAASISGSLGGTVAAGAGIPASAAGGKAALPAGTTVSFNFMDLGVQFDFSGTASAANMMGGNWSTSFSSPSGKSTVTGPGPVPGGGIWNANQLISPEDVPTLTEWGLIISAGLLLLVGIWKLGRSTLPGAAV